MKPQIKYKKGYKYQLFRDYHIKISLRPLHPVFSDFIRLDNHGNLTIMKGYAWDGCSGPTIDSKNNMRAGLVHDALFQLMREGGIPRENFRYANRLFKKILKEDGMWALRRALYFRGVSFTKFATLKKNIRKIFTAP